MTGAKVPKLRFPEFSREWEFNLLKNISTIYDGTHQTPTYTSFGVKFISVENIKDIDNPNKFISKSNYDKDFKVKPIIGDIFMTRITAGVIGETAIVKNNDDLAYYVSLALIRPTGKINSDFLTLVINTSNFKRELHRRIIHVAFPKKINLGDIGQCKLNICGLTEQTKIAEFLGAVDEKIKALRQKHGLLKDYKRGIMQKIFTQQIRFKKDDGTPFPDWEEKALDDICDMQSGKFIQAANISGKYEDGMYPCYGGNGLRGYAATFTNNGRFPLIGRQGAQCGNINLANGLFYATEHAVVATPKYKTKVDWLFYNLVNLNLNQYATGQAQPGLSVEVLKKITSKIPTYPDEQQKIADFLSSIDNKIDATQSQIDQMTQFKKGLLQQMFV